MSGEPEPRRSVRATKGQHKALEHFDQPIELPKKRGKKGKQAAQDAEEEIIRCVCGATEQDGPPEPWIACDICQAWQHNICMGISPYKEDAPKNYWCEKCHPQDHKELLESLKTKKPLWVERRKAYEEEMAEEETGEQKQKKKKVPKKAKGKRLSDPKEAPKQSPAPEPKKETKVAAGKRKARDESQEKEPKPSQKLRKVSETQAVPVPVPVPAYDPPADIPASIDDLPESRSGTARALSKSLAIAITAVEKKGLFTSSDGSPVAARAERYALEIERAVHDTHPSTTYAHQSRTLAFNLKNNHDLALGLLRGTLTPPMLAAKTTEELASKELQRETAEMKARAEKQSILIAEEGPRVRRTHKGEEIVSDDTAVATTEETPSHTVRRPTIVHDRKSESLPPPPEPEGPTEPAVELPAHIEQTATPSNAPSNALHINTNQSPKPDFDINKVFSSVKSPTTTVNRRPSALPGPSTGPGVDPEVDRMLREDGSESPPYSPTEENDPNVVWRGNLLMNTIADFPVIAKHVGGAKLSETIGLPWADLFPKRLTVAGRIDQQKAVEYLCSLRYSTPTDIVVTSLEPASQASKPAFLKLVDYFVSKARYGVVGDKGIGNVRDTYLVPVLPGTGGHPEFMLNLVDNYIPETRTEKMLLCVFVYRNEASNSQRRQATNNAGQTIPQSPVVSTPTSAQGAFPPRSQPIAAPQFSPTSPQGPLPNYPTPRNNSQTPVQPPHVPHNPPPPQPPPPQPPLPGGSTQSQKDAAQREGERVAREVLGALISSPTVAFIMPHAWRMLPKEWHLIREVYERDVQSRVDLNRLSALLAERSSADKADSSGQSQPAPPVPAPVPAPQPLQPQAQPQFQTQAQPQPPPQLQPQRQRQSQAQQQVPQPQQQRAPPAQQTPIPPPQIPTGALRQTPIPPPNIPIPHHTPATAAPSAPPV